MKTIQPRRDQHIRTGRRHRVRALAVGLLASVVWALGLVQAAAPASAATGVSYCFVHTNGAPAALLDTRLQVWTGTGWLTVAYDRTSSRGCGSFNTAAYANYYVNVAAGAFTSQIVGQTPYHATPGSGSVYLGTGVVWMRWI